jgi:hypothetical protein
VSGPAWLRWVFAVACIVLAGARVADLIGPRPARRGTHATRRAGFLAAAGVAMPLGMSAMASPVGDPARTQDAALALGALTAGLAIAAQRREVDPATEVALDDWLTVELSGAAMVLAAVAGHGAGTPVELAATVPPLTYPCVRAAARSITRRPSSLLRDGGDLAANAGMISMLLTML